MNKYKMNNNESKSFEQFYLLTNIEDFKFSIKNYLIEYTNSNYSDKYGLVFNILYNEMNDFINNIKIITDNKIILKDNHIYIVKNCKLNFENIKDSYPEPVKNAFINTINNFLKIQNI